MSQRSSTDLGGAEPDPFFELLESGARSRARSEFRRELRSRLMAGPVVVPFWRRLWPGRATGPQPGWPAAAIGAIVMVFVAIAVVLNQAGEAPEIPGSVAPIAHPREADLDADGPAIAVDASDDGTSSDAVAGQRTTVAPAVADTEPDQTGTEPKPMAPVPAVVDESPSATGTSAAAVVPAQGGTGSGPVEEPDDPDDTSEPTASPTMDPTPAEPMPPASPTPEPTDTGRPTTTPQPTSTPSTPSSAGTEHRE